MKDDAFTPSTKMLDDQIVKATHPEEIRELVKQYWERTGVIRRSNEGDEVLRQPEFMAPLPVTSSRLSPFSRIFYVVNDRHEIFAESEEQLDAIEQRVRAIFQR